MNWILIVLVVAIGFFIFKFRDFRHKFSFFFVAILVLFLLVTAGTLFATHKLDLTSAEGIVNAGKLYFNWLGSAFVNVFKIGGYAIKQDWSFNYTNGS